MIDTRRSAPQRRPKPSRRDTFDVDVLKLLRRYWPIAVLCVLVGWGAAAAYCFVVPPVYESSSEIMLLPRDQALVVRGPDGASGDSTLSDTMMATFVDALQKTRVISAALEKKNLSELPSLIGSMREKDQTVANYVIRNLEVERGGEGPTRESHIIKVRFKHSNQEDSQKVVEAVVAEFIVFVNEKFQDKNVEAARLIQDAEAKYRDDLANTRSSFEQFQKNTPILLGPDQSTNIYRTQYEMLQTALTELRLQRSEVASRLDMVNLQLDEINARATDENIDPKILDLERLALIDEKSAQRVGIFLEIFYGDAQTAAFQEDQPMRIAVAQAQNSELMKLKSERAQLASEFGEGYGPIVQLDIRIQETERLLNEQAEKIEFDEEAVISPEKIVAGYIRLLRNDIAEFDARERQLEEDSRIAEERAKELIQYELDGEKLRLDLANQQDLYEATVERLRDINMTKEFGGFIIEEMEPASLGEVVWPSLPICLVLGTLLGGFVACSGAAASEIRNRSLRSSEDIEGIAQVPILSYVPTFSNFRSRTLARSIRQQGLKVATAVYTVHSPQSQESEVFRGLRTSLFFRSKQLNAKVLAITSSNSGDGKSTVTANLAASMAQSGRKVLLIEADMRRPCVANLLGVRVDKGLAEVLQGSEKLDNVVVKTDSSDLAVLAAGGEVANPAELLSSGNLAEMLEEAADHYDYILIDCPPVLAVSDPCVVAGVADAVMVVVKINPHSRVELQKTMSMLSDVHANVMGVVVNASQLESESGSGKNAYMNSYGYGPRGQNARRYYINQDSRNGHSNGHSNGRPIQGASSDAGADSNPHGSEDKLN